MTDAWDPFEGRPDLVGGRYRIGSVIGTGGAAVVYRAYDEEDEVDVAAKLVEAPALRRPLRFLAEVRDMALLRHPRVVPVLAAGQEGSFYWMIMPLMRGGSLKEVVAEGGPLAAPRALEVVFQMLQGLDAVHTASLIHRDIKPHNVLLDSEGDAYLTDFGLARHLEGDVPFKTRTGESLGSPSYRAPEQARQASAAGREADLYGTGGVLFWVLTAKRPGFFFMLEEGELVEAFQALPAPAKPIVRKAMTFKPEERYRSAREMAVAVAAAYDDLPARRGEPPQADAWMSRFDGKEPAKSLWGRLSSWFRA